MGFRFRKSIRLAPGIRLNLSKGGGSVSIGRPGATLNLGKRGLRATAGVPGTGLSYSQRLGTPSGADPTRPRGSGTAGRAFVVLLALFVVAMMVVLLAG